ncbi:MAG: hypothetical protein Q7T03_04505 [Deltaproteobacteria bacterium]|nr:hypothetical protein [Deltaproteobacteria bacterium]
MGDPNSFSPIAPKPLACLPGDRPPMIPHVSDNENAFGERTGTDKPCGVQEAKKAYQLAVDSYEPACKAAHPCDAYEGKPNWQVPAWCKNRFKDCSTHGSSIPMLVENFDIDKVDHPFFNIAYHLDAFGVEDFRSASVFAQVAENPEIIAQAKTATPFTILYPASGSHMTALFILVKLIDQKTINSGKIIYTEIDSKAFKRTEAYLQFLASPETGIFKNMEQDGTTFKFTYNGRPIVFVFALNEGGELYAKEDYIREADLVIFHDGVYNDLDQPAEKGVANRFLKRLLELSRENGAKPRHVLTERQLRVGDGEWDCSPKQKHCLIQGDRYEAIYIKGSYGCGGAHFFATGFEYKEGQLTEIQKRDAQDFIRAKPAVHLFGEKEAYLLSIPVEGK